jgi:hypothetical protein
MIFRNYNINPVSDDRPRFHEKDCQQAIEIHFAISAWGVSRVRIGFLDSW